MPIDYERLVNWKIPDTHHRYTLRDTIFYALSIGFGADPEDEGQVRYAYEKSLLAVPAMATVLAAPGGWIRDPGTGVHAVGLLAGEQDFELHQPLPVEGSLIGKTRVVDVIDLGKERGAMIYTQRDVFDEASGGHLFTANATTISRKDGGFGGPARPTKPKHTIPAGSPQSVCDLPTPANAALLFRLHNPLDPAHPDQHADLALARSLGHRRPTLHGLFSLGIACHAILRTVCEDHARHLKSMAVRFSASAYPGDTLRTEMWREGNIVSFQCRSLERDKIVLSNGRATVI